MATAEQTASAATKQAANLPAISGPRLPYHPLFEKKFGVTSDHWRALVTAIYPNAKSTESVLLAMTYCKSRNLDIFKRPVHIVAIWSEADKCFIDSVWPGIGELRTTAHRTGKYSGKDDTIWGPDVSAKVGEVSMTYPAWAQVIVYRIVEGLRVAFHGPRVRWLETYAVRKRGDDSPNSMWADRPFGQLEKCAEAAALRMAFPEECGEYIADEVEHHFRGQVIDATSKPSKPTLDSLTDKFQEAPYTPPTSEAKDEPTDEANQGDAPDDVDQRTEQERAPHGMNMDDVTLIHLQESFEAMTGITDTQDYHGQMIFKYPQFREQLDGMKSATIARIKGGRGANSNK